MQAQRGPTDYYAYLDELVDIPALQELIELHKPDIVGVDQVSLMDDYRAKRGDQRRMELTHQYFPWGE